MSFSVGIIVSFVSAWPLWIQLVDAFVPRSSSYQPLVPKARKMIKTTTTGSKTIVALSSRYVEIPLLDFLPPNEEDSNDDTKQKEEILVQPLPSIHLLQLQQPELSNLNIYGMKLTIPLHQQIINHAWDMAATNTDDVNPIDFDYDMMPQPRGLPYNDPSKIPLVGVVAYKPPTGTTIISRTSSNINQDKESRTKHPAIGAIGCAVQVLYNAANTNNMEEYKQGLNIDNDTSDNTNSKKKKKKPIRYNTPSTSKTVLCRGLFRFVVRDIKQSIPYTVALVEELQDSNGNDIMPLDQHRNTTVNDPYANMTTTELMQRTLQSMQLVIDRMMQQAIQSSNQPLSPLEESILQDNGMLHQQQQVVNDLRETAQEYNIIWNIFRSSLVDMTPNERYYAVPFMAAEICHFSNSVRRQMLITINPIERLRIACRVASTEVAAMTSTSSTTSNINNNPIVSTSMEGITVGNTGGVVAMSQTLNVGTPKLPSWSKKIKKGTILEYYWNEEYGWCRGQVIEDPLRIVPDEIVLTMHFPDDDSIHRLPFSADEKVRWRPPSSSSSSSSSSSTTK